MIWMVVEATDIEFPGSTQFTTVPFKPMLTESMDNVAIRGEAPCEEFRIQVNVVEFTVIGIDRLESDPAVVKIVTVSSLPSWLATVKLHSIVATDAVHVS